MEGAREHHEALLAGVEHERVLVHADVEPEVVEHPARDDASLPLGEDETPRFVSENNVLPNLEERRQRKFLWDEFDP